MFPTPQLPFSLADLAARNPALARPYLWAINPWPTAPAAAADRLLHIGCGANVLPGFVNVDFVPEQPAVLAWNLLNLWPTDLDGRLEAAFSEDVMEHLFYDEQLYVLCAMNCALKDQGVYRVLMPDGGRLCDYAGLPDLAAIRATRLAQRSGFTTGLDLVNFGLRFSGHRWLHNAESLAVQAAQAGFAAVATSCVESTDPRLSGLNSRTETNSLSFATDLVKQAPLTRLQLLPTAFANLEVVEKVQADLLLCRATSADPQVHYQLPGPVAAGRLALLNFRGSNLSQVYEHNYATVYLAPTEAAAFPLDSSLRSSPCCNLLSQQLIGTKVAAGEPLPALRFDPGQQQGDYFTVGPLEVFITP